MNDEPLLAKIDVADPERTPTPVKGSRPLLPRVLLDLNRAALAVGDGDIVNSTLDELDDITTGTFLGYCPHYYLQYAQCLLTSGNEEQRPLAADLIERARALGARQQNSWAAQAADHLKQFV